MSAEAETPSAAWVDWQALTEEEKQAHFDRWMTFDDKIPGILSVLSHAEQTALMEQMPTPYLKHLTAIVSRSLESRKAAAE